LGAKTTIARSLSTNPAAQTPTASTSSEPVSERTSLPIVRTIASGSVAGDSVRSRAISCPRSSTRPAAIFVPPTSTPTV
jgi:hypothetical protein